MMLMADRLLSLANCLAIEWMSGKYLCRPGTVRQHSKFQRCRKGRRRSDEASAEGLPTPPDCSGLAAKLLRPPHRMSRWTSAPWLLPTPSSRANLLTQTWRKLPTRSITQEKNNQNMQILFFLGGESLNCTIITRPCSLIIRFISQWTSDSGRTWRERAASEISVGVSSIQHWLHSFQFNRTLWCRNGRAL